MTGEDRESGVRTKSICHGRSIARRRRRFLRACDFVVGGASAATIPRRETEAGGVDAPSADRLLIHTFSGKSGPAHFQGREIDFKRAALIRLQESSDDGRVEVGPRAFRYDLLGV